MRLKLWKLRIYFVFIFCFFSSSSFSQRLFHDDNTLIRDQIIKAVHKEYGDEYAIHFYVLDSLIGKETGFSTTTFEDIEDPYHQLSGVTLFCAYLPGENYADQDCSILGIFKDNHIYWTAPDFIPGVMLDLFSCSDLNEDGTVDIVTLWSGLDYSDSSEYAWILSWNGDEGKIINKFSMLTRESAIRTLPGKLQLLFPGKENTYALRGYVPDLKTEDFSSLATLPYVTYGWNGKSYGLWSTIRQVSPEEFLPANRVKVNVQCNVSQKDTLYDYNYTISNSKESRQRIKLFNIAGATKNVIASSPESWQSHDPGVMKGREWLALDFMPGAWIKPGQIKDGFRLKSPGLPAIASYNVHAFSYVPILPDNKLPSEKEFRDDVLKNSVTGYTLAPRVYPSQYTEFAVIESLKADVKKAHSIGWIANATTKDKYLKILNFIYQVLRKGEPERIKFVFGKMKEELNREETTNFSKEIYTVLSYNMEFIRKIYAEK